MHWRFTVHHAGSSTGRRRAELGITQSVNRPGTFNDNAYIKWFFYATKSDIVHGLRFIQDG